jgi:hypothetical protein
MDEEKSESVTNGKRRTIRLPVCLILFLALAGGAILGWFLLSVAPTTILAAKRAKLQNELNQVQTAFLSYYTEYAEYPVTSDNATLIKILTGLTANENSRQIAFLTVKPSDENAKGELLDPWGTPLEMSVTHDGVIHLRSAGPDKIFGTADDITNQKM